MNTKEKQHSFSARSLTFRITLLFVLASLLLCAVTYIFLYMQTKTSYTRHAQSQTASRLTAVDNLLGTQLVQMQAQMNTLLHNTDVTSMITAPDREDFSRLYQTTAAMTQLITSNSLIQDIQLIIYSNQSVLCPDGTFLSLEDSKHTWVSDISQSMGKDVDGHEDADLICRDGKLYLMQNYPTAKHISTLLLTIDSDALYQSLSAVVGGSSPIYLYDSQGNALFSTYYNYPEEKALLAGSLIATYSSCSFYKSAHQKNTDICLQISEMTDCRLVSFMNSTILGSVFFSGMPYLIPMLIVILGVFFLLAGYFVQKICRPIEHLAATMQANSQSALASGSQKAQKGNELETITRIYTNTARNEKEMAQMLSRIQPEVQTRLLSQILLHGVPENRLNAPTWSAFLENFPVDSHYTILSLKPDYGSDPVPEDADVLIDRIQLRTLAEDFWQNNCRSYRFFVMPNDMIAGVLCFTEEISSAHITILVRECRKKILHMIGNRTYYPGIGECHRYSSLKELNLAWEEACKDLSYQIYYRAEAKKPAATEESVNDAYYQVQLQQILENSRNQKQEAFTQQVETFLQSLKELPSPESLLHTLYNTMTEQILKNRQTISEPPAFFLPGFEERPLSVPEKNEIFAYLKKLLLSIDTQNRQSGYQYVQTAREYIQQNLADSNLSLDSTAQYVGISSPYLSTLFSQELGQGFADYLRSCRIQHACQLLTSTNLTVSEIGFKAGFNSPNSFIRSFKKIMQLTPGQYRDTYLHK